MNRQQSGFTLFELVTTAWTSAPAWSGSNAAGSISEPAISAD